MLISRENYMELFHVEQPCDLTTFVKHLENHCIKEELEIEALQEIIDHADYGKVQSYLSVKLEHTFFQTYCTSVETCNEILEKRIPLVLRNKKAQYVALLETLKMICHHELTNTASLQLSLPALHSYIKQAITTGEKRLTIDDLYVGHHYEELVKLRKNSFGKLIPSQGVLQIIAEAFDRYSKFSWFSHHKKYTYSSVSAFASRPAICLLPHSLHTLKFYSTLGENGRNRLFTEFLDEVVNKNVCEYPHTWDI